MTVSALNEQTISRERERERERDIPIILFPSNYSSTARFVIHVCLFGKKFQTRRRE